MSSCTLATPSKYESSTQSLCAPFEAMHSIQKATQNRHQESRGATQARVDTDSTAHLNFAARSKCGVTSRCFVSLSRADGYDSNPIRDWQDRL